MAINYRSATSEKIITAEHNSGVNACSCRRTEAATGSGTLQENSFLFYLHFLLLNGERIKIKTTNTIHCIVTKQMGNMDVKKENKRPKIFRSLRCHQGNTFQDLRPRIICLNVHSMNVDVQNICCSQVSYRKSHNHKLYVHAMQCNLWMSFKFTKMSRNTKSNKSW